MVYLLYLILWGVSSPWIIRTPFPAEKCPHFSGCSKRKSVEFLPRYKSENSTRWWYIMIYIYMYIYMYIYIYWYWYWYWYCHCIVSYSTILHYVKNMLLYCIILSLIISYQIILHYIISSYIILYICIISYMIYIYMIYRLYMIQMHTYMGSGENPCPCLSERETMVAAVSILDLLQHCYPTFLETLSSTPWHVSGMASHVKHTVFFLACWH